MKWIIGLLVALFLNPSFGASVASYEEAAVRLSPYFRLVPGEDFTIHVGEGEKKYAAEAGPNHILIGIEMIKALPEDQLWFVVAHEMAHIHNEDSVKWMTNMFFTVFSKAPEFLFGMRKIDENKDVKVIEALTEARFDHVQKIEYVADVMASRALSVMTPYDGCKAAQGFFNSAVEDDSNSGHGSLQERIERSCK